MTRFPLPPQLAEAHSRELLLVCTRDGKVELADARATRLLGLEAGGSLTALAAPGTSERLLSLLEAASAGPVAGWEMPLIREGRAVTVAFSGEPHQGAVFLLGHLIPEQFAEALTQVSEAMADVVDLNRQLAKQKREAVELSEQLRESNRGVLTLHAELEDRADELRRAADVKSRVVSNVSHEFRTPLNSILGLTQLLLDSRDGPISDEQAKQIGFVRQSAEELIHLVNDLLDLSKVEAGKATLRAETFDLGDFLGSMRGVLRPLLPADSQVALRFDFPASPISLETDKAKLSQILRNLVSNAIKFTERGEIQVGANATDTEVALFVRDTGIGIAPQFLDHVFEEFAQVPTPIPENQKGTGLGLPLSRNLARLLGGKLEVQSETGKGSTFTLTVPRQHAEVKEMNALVERSRQRQVGPSSILVVEDDRKTLFVYEKYLVMAGFHVLPARSVHEAREVLKHHRPAAIVLDVVLEGESSWAFLADLKRSPDTQDIPVLVVTVTNREHKARALGADEFWLKPVDQQRLLKRLRVITGRSANPRVLVIDDDATARYLIKKHLEGSPYVLSEAADGHQGVVQARNEAPDVILLDFLLKDLTAFDVLDELKADPRTRAIPVIVVTSHVLDMVDQKRLLQEAEAIISKQHLSRELAINRIRDALQNAGVGTSRES